MNLEVDGGMLPETYTRTLYSPLAVPKGGATLAVAGLLEALETVTHGIKLAFDTELELSDK